MKNELILCTGGGTGGHVFPGVAVVERLSEQWEGKIGWIGSSRGVEREIIASYGIPFWGIPAGKLRRYLSFLNIIDVFRVLGGVIASLVLLLRLRPRVLFSKGGFVSVPPVFAARILGIPVYSHESDVDPGLATRINLRSSERLFIPYEESRAYYGAAVQPKLVVIGNPVRRRILEGDAERGRRYLGVDGSRPIVLFAGGSQGAQQINEAVAHTLPRLLASADVVHQRGRHPAPRESDAHYVSFEFVVDEFADVLAAADLVVARAGAGTIWELAATGSPAVLIPLMYGSSRGDQVRNAELYSAGGAAVSLVGDQASPDAIAREVEKILGDATRRADMSQAARAFAARDAARVIATTLREAASRR